MIHTCNVFHKDNVNGFEIMEDSSEIVKLSTHINKIVTYLNYYMFNTDVYLTDDFLIFFWFFT